MRPGKDVLAGVLSRGEGPRTHGATTNDKRVDMTNTLLNAAHCELSDLRKREKHANSRSDETKKVTTWRLPSGWRSHESCKLSYLSHAN